MNAVFISDLHLNPAEPLITERFKHFIDWVKGKTKALYILGDFFHVWPGDDAMTSWSLGIAELLKDLQTSGVVTYFMPGNRDFLIGKEFLEKTGLILLPDPTIIYLDKQPILLSHGDRYCTDDRTHQWLRYFTRNRVFSNLFLKLPLHLRIKLVGKIRKISQEKKITLDKIDVVKAEVLAHMKSYNTYCLIHGHTHSPGLSEYTSDKQTYQRYVLSDWDDKPQILCYDGTKGLYFNHLL